MSHFPVSALSVSGSEGVISACISFHFRKKGTPIESRSKDIIFFFKFARKNNKMKVLILNGPNLNLIGRREPQIYGTESLIDFVEKMKNKFPEHQLDYFQSNHEGVLIDKLHEAWDNYDGVVFNPGAYCHTSIALADAIRSIETPVVEVHISDIYSREEYRHHSYTAEASVKSIVGKGLKGYEEAVLYLIGTLN